METIKLLAVTGYYQEGNNLNFVEEKSWKGTVLLREDLTFEGIVADNSATTNFDRLISGTLVEYNGTSLIKFSNHGLCPCSFFGMSTGKEIIGGWAVHDYLFTHDAGRSKIIFTEIPMDEFFRFMGMQLLMNAEIAGICFGVSSLTGKNRMGIGLGIALLCYCYDVMGRVIPDVKKYLYLGPYSYCNASEIFTDVATSAKAIIVAVVLLVSCTAFAFWNYNKRDLAS